MSDMRSQISMLDELIGDAYNKIKSTIKEEAKLGDFLKMLETRRKLAPGESDQSVFWQMIEKLRNEELSERSAGGSKPKKKTRKKRTAA